MCNGTAGAFKHSPKKMKILECGKCGLAFQEIFPIEILEPYQSLDYYEAWWVDKASEERFVRSVKEKTANWVLAQIEPYFKPGARLLEVGCAFGYFLSMAKNRGYEVSGIEISEAADQAIRAGLKVSRLPLEKAIFKKASFDAVIMLDVLEHFPDPNLALKKILELLSPGGILVLSVPNFGSFTRKLFGRNWWHFIQEHLHYFSKKSLTMLLKKNGFKALQIKTAMKGTSLSYISACSEAHKRLPSFINKIICRLPRASASFIVPCDLFCIARRNLRN